MLNLFSNLGSGENGEYTFIDILAIIGFLIAFENLGYNISQDDMQKQTQELDGRLHETVDEIHRHLREQDEKIDRLLELVKGVKHEES